MRLSRPVLGGFLIALGIAGLLPAASLTIDPNPTLRAGWSNCANFAGYNCLTTAYFNAGTLFDNDDVNISSLFVNAFDAWNNSGGGQGWTLNNGGALTNKPNGGYLMDTAQALQFAAGPVVANANVVSGGEEIHISTAGVNLPALGANDQLVWVQGLYDNYLLNGSIVTPFYEMDIASGACGGTTFCPPAYPFQYNDDSFYDRPRASYQAPGTTQAFFDANAYLAVENTTTKTLTVYDGISYGFQNFVSPEPGTWMLFCGAIPVLAVVRRRFAARN